jgi:hypothetical protein
MSQVMPNRRKPTLGYWFTRSSVPNGPDSAATKTGTAIAIEPVAV